MTEADKYWIWLSTCTDVNLNSIAALTEFYGTAEKAYHAPEGSFLGIEGIQRRDAEILERRDMGAVEGIIEKCQESGIQIITRDDNRYPKRLQEIFAPPAVLYVKGSLPDIDASVPIAVIGTRRASEYGLKMGRNFSYELSKCGAVIVSLLTAGIDAAAADGALFAEGTVIGVLGTPVDAASSPAAEVILERGALISEYAPGTASNKAFFRARNRIAAGISCGVVVIEAPRKSCTRLFVAEALEQGKEIYALPSNADSENGAGTLQMLREGARIALHGWHVAEDFPGMLNPKIRKKFPSPESEKKKTERTVTVQPQSLARTVDASRLEDLSDEQIRIVRCLNGKEKAVDEIIDETGLPASVVLGELTMMEIIGVVRKSGGACFTLA